MAIHFISIVIHILINHQQPFFPSNFWTSQLWEPRNVGNWFCLAGHHAESQIENKTKPDRVTNKSNIGILEVLLTFVDVSNIFSHVKLHLFESTTGALCSFNSFNGSLEIII